MSVQTYIWIPNWDGPSGFQHYKERDPIWIKNYTRLLNKDEYLALSSHRRGILHGLWMAYATSNRRLRGDTRSLSQRLQIKVSTSDLESLNHAGFIEFLASNVLADRLQAASRPLALTRADARSRETEEETETKTDPRVQTSPSPTPEPEPAPQNPRPPAPTRYHGPPELNGTPPVSTGAPAPHHDGDGAGAGLEQLDYTEQLRSAR